jgi:hypothetical protein
MGEAKYMEESEFDVLRPAARRPTVLARVCILRLRSC